MEHEHILILSGGNSSEREISLKTGQCVYNAAKSLGMNADLKIVHHFSDIINTNFSPYSYVFIALHGGYGEDGRLQAFLSAMNMRHNGANYIASGIGMNKMLTKDIAYSLNLNTPSSLHYHTSAHPYRYDDVVKKVGTPFIVKPVSQGCSKGVFVVTNEQEYLQSVKEASLYEDSLLIEQFITGKEITVGILAGEILPIVDIIYDNPIFDYDTKFTPGRTSYEPSSLSHDIQQMIQKDSLKLFTHLNIHDYGRLDFIIDASNKSYLLEINTLPGLNEKSVYPQACYFKGLTYDEMIRIIQFQSLALQNVR